MEIKTDQNLRLFIYNRKYLLLSVVLVWLAIFLIFFALKPQIGQISGKRHQLTEQRSKLNQLSKKNKELEKILSSPEFAQKDKVNEVLPSYKPLLELLSNLNQAAREYEVTFSQFEISPGRIATASAGQNLENLIQEAKQEKQNTTQKIKSKVTGADQKQPAVQIKYSGTGYKELSLELGISGKNEDVKQFMALIEKAAPLTTITDFSIKHDVSTKESNEAGYDASTMSAAEMTMVTYSYDRVITTSPSAPLPQVGEEEMKIFETIQEFRPSNFQPQETLRSSDLEDLFGVNSVVTQLK